MRKGNERRGDDRERGMRRGVDGKFDALGGGGILK
jgi:hypothetical protein